MKNKLISVIVPVYNVENYLEKCLDSIINQVYKKIEIILINDGSTDLSSQICDDYQNKDNRIIVIHKSNEGPSEARNSGLNIAQGEYIAFIDSDDYIDELYLDTLFNLLINTNSDISCCSFYSENKKEHNPKIQNINAKKVISYMLQDRIVAPSACGKLFKKYIFNGLRFPKGRIFEDFFTAPLFFSKADYLVITSEQLYYYRVNQNGIMRSKFDSKYIDIIEVHNEVGIFLKSIYDDQKLLKLVYARKARFCIAILNKYVLSNFQDENSKKRLLKEIKSNYFYFFMNGTGFKEKAIGLLYLINFNLTAKIIIGLSNTLYRKEIG